jgi:hypothetical protein
MLGGGVGGGGGGGGGGLPSNLLPNCKTLMPFC